MTTPKPEPTDVESVFDTPLVTVSGENYTSGGPTVAVPSPSEVEAAYQQRIGDIDRIIVEKQTRRATLSTEITGLRTERAQLERVVNALHGRNRKPKGD